jgi:small nuclear ribonucleoprotein (snRNP)-like protein
MTSLRQFVSLGLVVVLLHLSLVDVAQSAEPTASPNPAAVKQRVDLLGVGAEVKVRLTDGKKLDGTIHGIEERTFLLRPKASSPTPVAYELVSQLKFAKETYKARGEVDAAEARRVVVGLGTGRHIVAKTKEAKEYHGNIQAIDADHFTVLPDNSTAPVRVAYCDVLQLGPNMSKGTKILIIVCVGIAVVVILAVALSKPSVSIPPI